MFGEKDNIVDNDEAADLDITVPEIEVPDGEDETVQVPASKLREMQKATQTAIAQKKHWRSQAIDPETGKKYKDARGDSIKNNNDGADTGSDPASETLKRVDRLELSEEKRNFGHQHNYSPAEVDKIFAYAAGLNKKPVDVLEDTFITGAIDAARRQERIASGTPRGSNRVPMVEGKTFGQMNDEERAANFQNIVRGLNK